MFHASASIVNQVAGRSETRWGPVESVDWLEWLWLERHGYPTGEGEIEIHSDNGMSGRTTAAALDALREGFPDYIKSLQSRSETREEGVVGLSDWYTRPGTQADLDAIRARADELADQMWAEQSQSPVASYFDDFPGIQSDAWSQAKYEYEVANGILTQQDIDDMTRSELRERELSSNRVQNEYLALLADVDMAQVLQTMDREGYGFSAERFKGAASLSDALSRSPDYFAEIPNLLYAAALVKAASVGVDVASIHRPTVGDYQGSEDFASIFDRWVIQPIRDVSRNSGEAVPKIISLDQSSAKRAEVRKVVVTGDQVRAVLSQGDLDLVIKSRLGQDMDVVRKIEQNPELIQRAQAVIAAVAGKITHYNESLLPTAEILKTIANAAETPLAAFVSKVKKLLNVRDGAGLMAEMMPAGAGVADEDLVSYRAALMNPMQRVALLWMTDASQKATFEALAKTVVVREIKWAKAQGVDFEGRFEIVVIDSAKAEKSLKAFATEKYTQMKLVARDSGLQLNPMSFFVLAGTTEMLDKVDSETLRAAMIEREDYANAKMRGVARFVTAQLSQDVANKAELLTERTRQVLERNGNRYKLNPLGLEAMAAQLWSEVMAAFSLQKSA